LEIIGQGERLSAKILLKLFPTSVIRRQVPLKELLSKEFKEDMGVRALKETLDLVVFLDKPLVIRIQDDRHKTKAFGILDGRQRYELECSGCHVIDVFKYECPALFKEKNKEQAKLELESLLRDYI
jgi:hypothetical protein